MIRQGPLDKARSDESREEAAVDFKYYPTTSIEGVVAKAASFQTSSPSPLEWPPSHGEDPFEAKLKCLSFPPLYRTRLKGGFQVG